MAKHDLSGHCPKCQEIFDKYPGFNSFLQLWFEELQHAYPDAHISCAGRGKADQEACFKNGTSKAHYTQSSHNWNAAIDIFQLKGGNAVWDKAWFNKVVATRLNNALTWYGAPGSAFFELPHVQLKDWKDMAQKGQLALVEQELHNVNPILPPLVPQLSMSNCEQPKSIIQQALDFILQYLK